MSRTANLDSNLMSRQYELNLRAKSIQIKFENPKMKQSEIANQLSYSSSTLKRYRNDINMLSPYRIQSNNTNKKKKRFQILLLTTIHIVTLTLKDPKCPQMTSKQLKQIQTLNGGTKIF